jgi:hypothetical protein
MGCKLSILICTIPERDAQFKELIKCFKDLDNEIVEILVDPTPRYQISVGKKRQGLLQDSNGDYIVFFDDDDKPSPYYIDEILTALEKSPDCVGFKIMMTTNGSNNETCIHSLRNEKWEKKNGIYLRTVTHFNPVKRELALQVGFKDLRFGEDKDYSDRITPICKHEVFIDKYLFDYRYSTKEPHKQKYGIK